MSSPLARNQFSLLHKLLIRLHQRHSHDSRVRIVGKALADSIAQELGRTTALNCLDVGCGDMKISSCIQQQLPNTSWTGADIHEPSDAVPLPFAYRRFDGRRLPFADKEFDLVILSDALHHIPAADQGRVVCECARVGGTVLVKDHFEKGLFSRCVLMAMDFAGNWAYGVSVPRRYFSRESFLSFCHEHALSVRITVSKIELYNHLPMPLRLLLSPDLHFIAALRSITQAAAVPMGAQPAGSHRLRGVSLAGDTPEQA